MVGVVVLALVAGGLNVFDRSDDTTEVTTNVGQGRPIGMGSIDWPEGVASTYFWKEILQRRGFAPETRSLEVGALYDGQAQGSVDFQTNSWLPATHASYWAKYKDRLEDYGSWDGETSLEIAVPSFVKGVKSLDVQHLRDAGPVGPCLPEEGTHRGHAVVAALGVRQGRPDQAGGPPRVPSARATGSTRSGGRDSRRTSPGSPGGSRTSSSPTTGSPPSKAPSRTPERGTGRTVSGSG